MFEKNNQIAKFYGNGKLVSLKLNRKKNRKKRTDWDPDFLTGFRVELATFDTNTGKQTDCAYSLLSMDEASCFMTSLEIFGRKAYQLKVARQQKMPEATIFEKWAGYEADGRVISTAFTIKNGGPNMKADFFITIDEAEGYKDPSSGLFKRAKGARPVKKLQIALRAEDAIALSSATRSATDILNLWSAMGTIEQNLNRVCPLREEAEYPNKQNYNNRSAQTGYANQASSGYGYDDRSRNPSGQGYMNGYSSRGQQEQYADRRYQ